MIAESSKLKAEGPSGRKVLFVLFRKKYRCQSLIFLLPLSFELSALSFNKEIDYELGQVR